MTKLKKGIAMLGVACLLSANVAVPVQAGEIQTMTNEEDGVMPLWDFLQTTGVSLDISSSGLANCFSTMLAKQASYQCKIESSLYRIANSGWEKVTSFSDTAKGSATASKLLYVKKGYVYLLRSKFMVYDSTGTTLLESHTADYEQEY